MSMLINYFIQISFFFIKLNQKKVEQQQKTIKAIKRRQNELIIEININRQRIVSGNHKPKMAYPYPYTQKTGWGQFTNLEYNRLQSQIEQQTMNLLRERQNLSSYQYNGTGYGGDQPYLKPVESQKYIKLNSERSNRNSENSRHLISNKVNELLSLCRNENSAFSNELIKVLSEENAIHNELINSNKQSSQKTHYFGVANPIIQAQKQSTVVHNSQQRIISNRSTGQQSPTKINNPNGKTYLKEVVQTNGKALTGEQLIQMIEEIQRKALNQIEKLRQEKIDLMKQLKQQIQSNNQLQKEINQLVQQSRNQNSRQNINAKNNNSTTPFKQYQFDSQPESQKPAFQQEFLRQIRTEMDYLRRENQNLKQLGSAYQPSQGVSTQNSTQVYTLKQTIAVLEEQLHNRDEMIKRLSIQVNRLNQQGGNTSNYQLSNLLEQGESIRQNTLHLIRIKQGQSGHNQTTSLHESERIRQLEELLERQQDEKQNFLNDLLLFKQKYQQLEEENKQLKRNSSKLGNSEIAKFSPIYDKSSSNQGVAASIQDYQRILSQIKGYTRY